jgi:GntR family transcriptional regulator
MTRNIPIYIQIHDEIKKKIEDGQWKIGERLPSERDLSELFDVSRMTLRQAIQTLSDEGILDKRVGAGTFVASKRVVEKMSGPTSFSEIMESQGRVPSSKTIAYYVTSPTQSEIQNLKISEGSKVVRMERIRYADNIPICFEVATIPEELVNQFSKEDITSKFYQTLEKKGFKLGGSEHTISATIANEQISDFLSIKRGSAILRLRQISYFENRLPFEYVRTQYAGSRFEFFMEK